VSTPIPLGRGRWRLTLHARQFGDETWQQTIIATLDSVRNRKLVQAWDSAAQLSFDVDGHAGDAALIQELAHDVIAWRWDEASGADVAMFRGIVADADDELDESSHVVSFTCHDYFALLDRRAFTSPNQVVYTSLDQDTIAAALLTLASSATTGAGASFGAASYLPLQAYRAAGDGSTRVALSGHLVTLTVQGGTLIGTQLDQLAKLSGGFEYDVKALGASGGVADALRIFYPSQGVVRTDTPLIYGANVAKVSRLLSSADYANYWRVLGNNQSTAQSAVQVYGEATTPDAFNLLVGTFMSVDQTADQVDPALLGSVAAGQLGIHGPLLLPTYTLTLEAGAYTYGMLNMGDTAQLVIRSGRLNVNTAVRVLGLTYDIGDDGEEDVELVVGLPQTTLLDLFNRTAADIRQLSRR
jgi:hypothetical protein